MPAFAGASVLICDDDAVTRRLLSIVIGKSEEFVVIGEAADGSEVVEAAVRLRPDVILLDLVMPNVSGFDALRSLREAVPDARILVFSGLAPELVEGEVLGLGAKAYLQKSGFDAGRLIQSLRHVMAD